MFTYKKENQIPIKSWIPAEDYHKDQKMVTQVENLAQLPFAFSHIALSPDGHVGYGVPIGGILATKGVIIPNAVGVDIGCGMCAVKTSLTDIDTETLKKIMNEIRKAIPVGFNHHTEAQDASMMPDLVGQMIVKREYNSALKQLGTLGGGNHFIEIQKGSDGHIWIMIHSGSRNLGKQVADYYNRLAESLNSQWHSQVPKKWELAFLPIDSEEGRDYIREMNYCVDFAFANRSLMMDRIVDIFMEVMDLCNNPDHGLLDALSFRDEGRIGCPVCGHDESRRFGFDPIINIAHNYARMENHFGSNVMVHRKGATLATTDTIGIIPGSQGTKSYIVQGKGNPDSFNSCSHGAGRKMGRMEAQRNLNLEEEQKKLDNQGILHAIRGIKDLDEASGAYKPIDEVMKNQEDLVDILVELTPLGVIKG